MAEIEDGRPKILHHAVEGNADAAVKVDGAAGLLLQVDEGFYHLETAALLGRLHRVELLEEGHRILTERLVDLRTELEVVSEVSLGRA